MSVAESGKSGVRGRVLLMEDEDIVAEVAREMILHLGYDVETAREGREAVEHYERAMESGKPFDVVILDLTVPDGLGGREAVAALRRLDPGVKAVVSSGYSNDPVMSRFRDYGFDGVVSKPYKLVDLKNALEEVAGEDGGGVVH